MNDYQDEAVTVHLGDVREVLSQLPSMSVQCVVTSPPYWGLRDYGTVGQLGREATPQEYVCCMVDVFREVRRVLRKDGTCWVNLGDSYAGSWGSQGHRETPAVLSRNSILNHPKRASLTGKITEAGLKPKDLVGIPWRLAFALQADGWWLRSDIIWSKPNPMPESVTDRPTKSHEYLFLLTKSARYYYDAGAVREAAEYGRREWVGDHFKGGDIAKRHAGTTLGGYKNADRDQQNGHKRLVENVKAARLTGAPHDNPFGGDGRNRRTVWEIATQPYPDAHFATFPEELARIPILAGTRPRDLVLDPFVGSGTTLMVAKRLDRQAVGIELNPAYLPLIRKRVESVAAQVGLPL